MNRHPRNQFPLGRTGHLAPAGIIDMMRMAMGPVSGAALVSDLILIDHVSVACHERRLAAGFDRVRVT